MNPVLNSNNRHKAALAIVLLGLTFLEKGHTISVEEHYGNKNSLEPWFTGPLLAPSGHVVPFGHINVEPYEYYTVIPGKYDSNWKYHSQENYYTAVTQIVLQTGIYKNVGITIIPQLVSNSHKGKRYFGFGDLPVKISVQLREGKINSWAPAMRIGAQVNFPVGSYDGLDPNNLATDSLGTGSWLPNIGIVLSAIKQLGESIHFLGYRFYSSFTVGTATSVNGANVYGGDVNTKGTVFPGNIFQIGASVEANFTKRFGFAMDMVYNHFNKTRFTGKTIVPNTQPSAELFSIAPALEYNWSENIGIIAGTWFTVMGRNSSSFNSAVIAINIYN
ncbi:MAG: hypothetical protein FJZ57_03905 [Chlamydiae bacterium]|nr:hypothetical protein [Chlamydiota bacterium]